MLLVDTSVWVLSGRGLLDLEPYMAKDDLAICPPVLQEVLQGVRAAEYSLMRALLHRLPMLDVEVPLARFEYAVELYRRCREKGLTIRSSVDCLIAAIAVLHDVPLLHNDRDFEQIARVAPLRSLRV